MIVVDVMGGDYAPHAIVLGALAEVVVSAGNSAAALDDVYF